METPLTTRPKPPPLDLSHHYSTITNLREPSAIKKYYKYFQIPGLGNLAGGLPNAQFFPFDTLEAQAAKPERWTPSPNEPPSPEALADRLAVSGLSSAPNGVAKKSKHADTYKTKATKHKDDDPQNAQHLTVPMSDPQTDPFRKIDVTTALQYGTAEGYAPLLAYIRHFARTNLHPNVPYAKGPEVILTCGSTDGMAKSLELLVTPWDARHDSPRDRPHLLVEKFLYSNVLAQSMPRGVRPVPVEIDAEGMRADGPGGLEEVLSGWNDLDGKRPRIMYTVTMGHNPTSGVLSVERRMCRMARILDAGVHQLKQSTPTRDDLADWGVVTKTRLYDFDWARGGMFLWLRLRFETHPLWQARGRGTADGGLDVVDGFVLSHALLALGTRRPHLVIPAPGLMFAADDRVRAESAWAYLRLCFAAVAEEEIEPCTERFVGTVHKFWRIKSVREIEELLDEFNGYEALGDEGMGNLIGMGMGC
ncbi:Aromatic amino acid aminotransferase like protein [Verticillium longisporum]|nr:Aromatic amino acid aminotransferase like protein [Verticillium longisporum]